jgi:hypothetical protein
MLHVTLERKEAKALSLWDSVRESLAQSPKVYICALCGATQNATSQEYFRAGKAVCYECFEIGLREFLRERQRKIKGMAGAQGS